MHSHLYILKIFIYSNSQEPRQSIIFDQDKHKSFIHDLPFLTWFIDSSPDKTRSVQKKKND